LPEGKWIDFWTGKIYRGKCWFKYPCDLERIPVFIKNNSILAFNLNNDFEIGGSVGNKLSSYCNLSFFVTGELKDKYSFIDDLSNRVIIDDTGNNLRIRSSGDIKKLYLISSNPVSNYFRIATVSGREELLVYECIQ